MPTGVPAAQRLPASFRKKAFDKDLFIKQLYLTKSVVKAAAACGFRAGAATTHKSKDPVFAKRWNEAMDQFADELEASMIHRAIHGWKEPVFYKGEMCGSIRKYSTPLQIFMIKNLKPEKYSDLKADPNTVATIANCIVETVKRMDELSDREE